MKHSDPDPSAGLLPLLRIARSHPAERRGPVSGPNGTSSQGIIDLGGKGPSAGAFFSYTGWDPSSRRSPRPSWPPSSGTLELN